jgi:triosephosphate isomerase
MSTQDKHRLSQDSTNQTGEKSLPSEPLLQPLRPSPRTPPRWIAGNWKMNLTPAASLQFVQDLWKLAPQIWQEAQTPHALEQLLSGELQAVLVPPVLSLAPLQQLNSLSPTPFPLSIWAQNVHWESQGAFTGEISIPMLQSIGIPGSLVGHSERRKLFGETDASAAKRALALLNQNGSALFCVGETLQEREAGQTRSVLTRQIEALFEASHPQNPLLNPSHPWKPGQLLIAYEPVWAIGTGMTASEPQIAEAHAWLASELNRLWTPSKLTSRAPEVPLLYGGSVTPQNLPQILKIPHVQGALVGGASLKPDTFLRLLGIASVIQKT